MTINSSAPDETTSAAWKRIEKIQTFIMAAGLVTGLVGIGMHYAGMQAGEPVTAAGVGVGSSVAVGRTLMRLGREIDAPARPRAYAPKQSGHGLTR